MTKKIIFGSLMAGMMIAFAQSPEEGMKYLENEQFTKARTVFVKLLEKKQTGDNYYYLGNYYNKIEEYDSAKVNFEKGISLEPKNGLNYAGLGIVQWLKGDSVKALENFNQAIGIRKRDADVYFEISKALTYSDYKSPSKAMGYIDQAITYKKDNANFYLTKGDIFILKRDGTNAADNYNTALKINPKSVEAYIRKGKLYLRAKNTDAALVEYNKGIMLDPEYAPGYRERSELYLAARNLPKAIEDYRQYLKITDDNFENNLRFARFLFKNKEYDKAIEVASGLEKQAPKNVALTRILAYAYAEKKTFDKANEYLNKLTANTPADQLKAYDFHLLGTSLLGLAKDTAVAVENLLKAADLEPKLQDNYLTVGNMYYEKKAYDKAVLAYEKGFAVGKLDFTAKLNYGKSYYMLSDYTKSKDVFAKLIEMEPNIPNWYMWKLKNEVYLDQDYKTDAIKDASLKFIEATGKLKDIERYKKNLSEAYTYLGSYYCINQKNRVEAEANWKKALEFDAKNANATNALASAEVCK